MRPLLLSLFLFTSSGLFSNGIEWLTDYEEAKTSAEGEKKPLLLFFNGSDWSGWGMKMKREVLDSEEFAETIGASFFCMQIDFPKHKQIEQELLSQNEQLKEEMEIVDFPRVVVLDWDGRELIRTGYFPGGGKLYAEYLLAACESDRELSETMNQIDDTELSAAQLRDIYVKTREFHRGADALIVLEKGMQSDDPAYFQLERYRMFVEADEMQKAEALKREITSMHQGAHEIHFSLALIDFQHLSRQKPKDPEGVVAPLKAYCSTYGKEDLDNLWRLEMMIAQFYLDYEEHKVALDHAKLAYDAAPEAMKPDIERSVSYIQGKI